MTINLSTSVKYISSIALTAILVAGTIYAANITSISQTAGPTDTITSSWVNAVNNNAVNAAGAKWSCMSSAGYSPSVMKIVTVETCVSDTTCKTREFLTNDGRVMAWTNCPSPN